MKQTIIRPKKFGWILCYCKSYVIIVKIALYGDEKYDSY